MMANGNEERLPFDCGRRCFIDNLDVMRKVTLSDQERFLHAWTKQVSISPILPDENRRVGLQFFFGIVGQFRWHITETDQRI